MVEIIRHLLISGSAAIAFLITPIPATATPVKLQCIGSNGFPNHPLIVDIESKTIKLNDLKFIITQMSPKFITAVYRSSLMKPEINQNRHAGQTGGETVVMDRISGRLYRTKIGCFYNPPMSYEDTEEKCEVGVRSYVVI